MITTAIVIQYVAVDKTAQPKRGIFVQGITRFEKLYVNNEFECFIRGSKHEKTV
jgi:hypothetical protein